MSRYGWLVCMDCKVGLWLGSATWDESYDNVSSYHIGQTHDPRNWERPELNQVLWKILADHTGHELGVAVEGWPPFGDDLFDGMIEIGGDSTDDISFDDYLNGWLGLT